MKNRFSIDYLLYVGSFVPLLLVLVFLDFPDGTVAEKLLLSVLGLVPVLIGGYWAFDLVRMIGGGRSASMLDRLGGKERVAIALSASFVAQLAIFAASNVSSNALIYTIVLSPGVWVAFLLARALLLKRGS